MECAREGCGHDAVEHDPPPPNEPLLYGGCAVCDCEEFMMKQEKNNG
jgi:hypothetical protein